MNVHKETDMNGILNIYKEKGFTSHDAVAKLRGILKIKKIGHTGTLDPEAEGVLPVCIGKATKVCDLIMDKTKTYEAVLLLGTETDTQDMTGEVICKNEVSLDEDTLQKVLDRFKGEQEQIPPMYSACKVNGKRLYELARNGEIVERKPRTIFIHELEVQRISLPRVFFRITCSKGTYIRTLCHDIGKACGCGGCMEQLLRTRVGNFHIDDAKKLSKIEELVLAGRLEQELVSVDSLFPDDPPATVGSQFGKYLDNGNPIKSEWLLEEFQTLPKRLRIYDEEHNFYGIYHDNEEQGWYRPLKLFK